MREAVSIWPSVLTTLPVQRRGSAQPRQSKSAKPLRAALRLLRSLRRPLVVPGVSAQTDRVANAPVGSVHVGWFPYDCVLRLAGQSERHASSCSLRM